MNTKENVSQYRWFNLIAETEGQTAFQSKKLKGVTIEDLFIDGFRNIISYQLNILDGEIVFAETLPKGTQISINPTN